MGDNQIEDIVYKFAIEKNILIGICDADPLDYLGDIIYKDIPFTTKETNKRIEPKYSLESAKSIIVIGVPYGKKMKFDTDTKKRGRISLSAIGEDYHIVLKRILEELADRLRGVFEFEYKIFVDTGYLPERELAKKAGIGFQGKNCSIISKKFGSFIFLGHLLLDKKLISSEKIDFNYSECGDCSICQQACPTEALKEAYSCDAYRCVSYLTQSKGDIPEGYIKKMGVSIYGCDICQQVCPLNKEKEIGYISDIEEIKPDLDKFLLLTNSEFKEKYASTAVFWRGKKTLMRNAKIALENINTNTLSKLFIRLLAYLN